MKRLWIFIIITFCSMLYVGAIGMAVNRTTKPAIISGPQVASATVQKLVLSGNPYIDAINNARLDYGVSALAQDSRLAELSLIRAKDMTDRVYYSHTTPEGRDFSDYFEEVGLRSSLPSCENLLMHSSDNPDEVIKSWLLSDAHKACMLNSSYQKVGVVAYTFSDLEGVNQDSVVFVAIFSASE